MDRISQYLTQGVFGKGNCEWAKNPSSDPMFAEASRRGLAWEGRGRVGLNRIHYLHCSGVWVDRAHLKEVDGRMQVVETGDWADHFPVEWMPIPEDFPVTWPPKGVS